MYRLLREDILIFEQMAEATEGSSHVNEYLLMNVNEYLLMNKRELQVGKPKGERQHKGHSKGQVIVKTFNRILCRH